MSGVREGDQKSSIEGFRACAKKVVEEPFSVPLFWDIESFYA